MSSRFTNGGSLFILNDQDDSAIAAKTTVDKFSEVKDKEHQQTILNILSESHS